MTPSDTKLEPIECPFCGCKIRQDFECEGPDYERGEEEYSQVSFYGEHGKGCPLAFVLEGPTYDLLKMTKDEAIAAWNTRSTPSPARVMSDDELLKQAEIIAYDTHNKLFIEKEKNHPGDYWIMALDQELEYKIINLAKKYKDGAK